METQTIYVRENYLIEVFDEDNYKNPSDTDPNEVRIHGQDKDVYFYVALSNVTERPSPEWVSALGVEKYNKWGTEQNIRLAIM